jgi:4-hydroxy-tetrahydrodipicolinate reductase
MRIALIGYGKMGKAIEEVALQRGHEIVIKIDQPNLHEFTKKNMAKAEAAIEFTSPHTAYDNVKACIEFGVPIVCGSTGWTERLDEMKKICAERNGSFIYSSNFSVGVNIFFGCINGLAFIV